MMFAPRVKSKLSTLLYSLADLEGSGAESPSLSNEPPYITSQNHRHNKPTVSRLSFPFVKSPKSPSLKMVKPALLPLSNAFSLSQAALSTPSSKQDVGLRSRSPPSIDPPLFSYQPDPRRHEYRHRGYSRHALAHIKWFWVTQEEEWETRSGPVRFNKPRLDESFLETALDDPLATAGPSAPRRRTPLHPVHQSQHELPPMTIHPRRGDLSSLRDPYCIKVDRSFVVLPTWTIGKTLWMYDVHIASRDRASVDAQTNDSTDLYDDPESENESLDACSSSVGCTDDSDATLVDSETESDLSPGGSSSDIWDHCMDGKRFVPSRDTYDPPISPAARASLSALSDTSLSPSLESAWSRSAYSELSTPMRTCEASNHSWAKDWYQRWQCMIEVSNRQRSHDGNRNHIGQDPDDVTDYFSTRHNISHPSMSSGLRMPEVSTTSANCT